MGITAFLMVRLPVASFSVRSDWFTFMSFAVDTTTE